MVSQESRSQANGNGALILSFEEKYQNSIEILKKAFSLYEDAEMFLAFNGGKDCTALLHMVKLLEPTKNITVVYIQPDSSFIEIEEFVNACEDEYNIKVDRRKGNVKSVLEIICKETNYKCALMGNRKTDPHCSDLGDFHETDDGWPNLMRVNPLIDWTYHEVWEYLNNYHVNYCVLYDQGYTSIGDRTNTIRNPHLQLLDPNTGKITYQHARELHDGGLERAGRC